MYKRWVYGWMVNYILLTWKLACILRTYRTCNSTVKISKYKSLGYITLLKVIPFASNSLIFASSQN